MSGNPHLEEASWFGEGALPRLAAQGLRRRPAEDHGTLRRVPFTS